MRRRILARFCADYGRDLVANFELKHITAIIGAKAKAGKRDAANNLRKVLRHLFKHAVRLGWIKHNPVAETERLRTTGGGFHTWTDDEIARYRAHWSLGTQQRLCMELALELTARRSDVTKIGPQHRRGNVLDLRHTKNDSEAFIPLTPELKAAIDACPTKHLTYLHTLAGAPRSAKALGGDFRKWCDAAGLPKRCTLHGLRKGGARRLAEAGASAKEIMSVTGHKTLAEVQRYVDAADKAKLARQAMAKLRKSDRKR
jgi:integrase